MAAEKMIGTLLALALIVVSVADGDTLTIRDGDRRTTIRLAEIDAPERTQPFSQVARRNLATLCTNAKSIQVDPVAIDRFGRTVAHIRCDGVHVNWRQVEDGMAWARFSGSALSHRRSTSTTASIAACMYLGPVQMPEPGTLALLALGALGFAGVRSKRRERAAA